MPNGTHRWEIVLRAHVGNMERAMLAHPAKLWLINTDLDAANGYGTKMSPRNHSVPLAESQHHIINPTNPRRALDDGVEHRLHVGRRAADDAEHLGRCRLMLQGLAQFCVALLQFFEQPHVLDGDDGLIGEGFEKLDLFIGRTDEPPCGESESPRWRMPSRSNGVASSVRTPMTLPKATLPEIRSRLLPLDVMDMNRLPVKNRSAAGTSTI